jgi:hypothetical protein
MSDEKRCAIPTKFQGVQFRSRLEARWAAMFTMLGWRWDYEPCDFAGYIPDFRLDFLNPMYVEVKPIDDLHGWDRHYEELCPWAAVFEKIEASGVKTDFAIVGTRINRYADVYKNEDTFVDAGILGVMFHYWGFAAKSFSPGDLCPRFCQKCNAVVPLIDCDVNGCERVPGTAGHLVGHSYLNILWKQAGNLVQYKGTEAQP